MRAALEECRGRVEQALAALATVAERDARPEMKLLAALGASRLYTRGGVPEVASDWTKALGLAESLGDPEYQKRCLWVLWSFHVNGVDYRTALSLARRFASLAVAQPIEVFAPLYRRPKASGLRLKAHVGGMGYGR